LIDLGFYFDGIYNSETKWDDICFNSCSIVKKNLLVQWTSDIRTSGKAF